jgi:hypothetical protein
MLQDAFLKSSADVTVTFIEEKDTTLLIYGDLVTDHSHITSCDGAAWSIRLSGWIHASRLSEFVEFPNLLRNLPSPL